jgi:hypothetical protein
MILDILRVFMLQKRKVYKNLITNKKLCFQA